MPTIFFPPESLAGTVYRGVTSNVGVFPSPVGFEWGPVAGTTAGELLHVGYSGAVVTAATVELADGRILTMGIAMGELTILLPPDTPNGNGTVTATLADGSQRQLVIALVGTVVLPPVTPGVGPRRQPSRRPQRRILMSASQIELRSSSRVRVRVARVATIELRSSTQIKRGATPSRRPVRVDGRIRLGAAGARVQVSQRAPASMMLPATTSVQRRDGPRLEEALLLLELV